MEYNHTNNAPRVQAVIREDRTPILPVRSPAEDSLVAEIDDLKGQLADLRRSAGEPNTASLPKLLVQHWKIVALVLSLLGGGGYANRTLAGVVDDYEATIRAQIEAEKLAEERNKKIDAWFASASEERERLERLESSVEALTKSVATLSETVERVAVDKQRKPK